jgi:ubiquinone/menaquinone biosynthesis C-methylase UbiE
MSNETLKDDIHTNYNETGVAIIQRMFGEGYLSPRGEEATDQLIELAKPDRETVLLDVGSGLGGAALRLAEKVGCSVTGLDLVESNVQIASATAERRGLTELVRFQQGDATDLPFDDNSFTMIWGQDAWAHVPDRALLLKECARVLAPGGRIVFADFLLIGREDDFYHTTLLPELVCPSYETFEGYRGFLEDNGFVDIQTDDVSEQYASHYRQAMVRIEEARDWITETYSARVYNIVVEKNGYASATFDRGQIGGGHFTARLPA